MQELQRIQPNWVGNFIFFNMQSIYILSFLSKIVTEKVCMHIIYRVVPELMIQTLRIVIGHCYNHMIYLSRGKRHSQLYWCVRWETLYMPKKQTYITCTVMQMVTKALRYECITHNFRNNKCKMLLKQGRSRSPEKKLVEIQIYKKVSWILYLIDVNKMQKMFLIK